MDFAENDEDIFDVKEDTFAGKCLETFRFQYHNNAVYRKYCDFLNIDIQSIIDYKKIPFLPITFFKSHFVCCMTSHQKVFESSGTTAQIKSKHPIYSLDLYKKSFLKNFVATYGPTKEWLIFALLPSYLERSNSSLVYMMDEIIKQAQMGSQFILNQNDALVNLINNGLTAQKKIMLLGVSFALWDLAETGPYNWEKLCVIETGGMKGRKKEIPREQLHRFLKTKFGCKNIQSEYGMTELLSQAYAQKDGVFKCPPWMSVLIRDATDPFFYLDHGKTGGINIIDLANKYSCSFIQTDDLGKKIDKYSFEVIGRMDEVEARGCSLLLNEMD